MKKGNTENLRPIHLSHGEATENGRKGGKARAVKITQLKTNRELAVLLDSLPITGNNKDIFTALGIPPEEHNQQMARLVALHKKTLTGDPAAIKLFLEIKGEAPTSTVKVEMGDGTRVAYEKAAEAIKKKRG